MLIRDGWSSASSFELDREGLDIAEFDGKFDVFDDEAAIKSVFYQQAIDHVKKRTGAKRVVVFDHTVRRRLPDDLKQQTESSRPAVLLVHSDYTPSSGVQRVKDILPGEAEELLKGRVAFYNV